MQDKEELTDNNPFEGKTRQEVNRILFEKSVNVFEMFLDRLKIGESLLDISQHYDKFSELLTMLLSYAELQSKETKLDVIGYIKERILMALSKSEQLIELNNRGAYKPFIEPKPIFKKDNEYLNWGMDVKQWQDRIYKEPLLVAKTNKRIYEDIIDLLEREKMNNFISGVIPPKKKEKTNKKVGRPAKKLNPLHQDIRKEFLRLTSTNQITISKGSAKRMLIESLFKDYFKNYSSDDSRIGRLNTILREKSNIN